MSRIGVVAAMHCERRALIGVRAPPGEMFETAEGNLVGVSGPGADRARALAEKLLEHRVDHLLSWGLAGALVPQLKPGALLLPANLVGSDGSRYAVHASWWKESFESLGKGCLVHRESLAESPSIVECKAQKTALHAATDAVAVDMESVGVARVAEAAGVPFLCVRVVVDSLEHTIPAWVSDHLNHRDPRKSGSLLGQALCSPLDWYALLTLSLAFARALLRLRAITPVILADTRPTKPTGAAGTPSM